MPAFTTADGTELAYHVRGEGEPLLCLPGGPMRASAYLGDLGGLSRRRQLVMLDLRGTGDSSAPRDPADYRCDRQIGDVEALMDHLGWDSADVLAHSAGGDLAILHAAGHPERIRTLSLITTRARALGIDFTEEHQREAIASRAGEAWFETAGDAFDAIVPFHYGRWDAAAQAHAAAEAEQTNRRAAEVFPSPGAFDPAATRAAIARLDAPVLWYWRANWTAGRVPMSPPTSRSCSRTPNWPFSRAPVTTHGSTTPTASPGPSRTSSPEGASVRLRSPAVHKPSPCPGCPAEGP